MLVRIALCDDEAPLVNLVEDLVANQGHEVIGVADTTAAAVLLVTHGRPDLVIVDPAVGCNADFDVIDTACEVGADSIVFSRSTGLVTGKPYGRPPILVPKPDLVALDAAVGRLGHGRAGAETPADRRRRPGRESSGPPPSGLHDAAAFYGALNDALAGDALVAFVPGDGTPDDPGWLPRLDEVAARVSRRWSATVTGFSSPAGRWSCCSRPAVRRRPLRSCGASRSPDPSMTISASSPHSWRRKSWERTASAGSGPTPPLVPAPRRPTQADRLRRRGRTRARQPPGGSTTRSSAWITS